MMFPALMVVSFIAMKDKLLNCVSASDAFRVFTENGPQNLLLSNMKDLLQIHFIPKTVNNIRLHEFIKESIPEINEIRFSSPKAAVLSPANKFIKKNKPIGGDNAHKLIKFRKYF